MPKCQFIYQETKEVTVKMGWAGSNKQRKTSILFDRVPKARTNGYKMDNKRKMNKIKTMFATSLVKGI